MSLLGSAVYDPVSLVSKSTASLLAMTAVDTSNLRVTFTAPSSGNVLIRLRAGILTGASTSPQILLGVLEGSTVRARGAPSYGRAGVVSSSLVPLSYSAVVTGLTPSSSYTWDAAYGVEFAVASTNMKYGGPTTGATGVGAFSFEVWTADGLLAATHYDPSTVANQNVGATQVLTALDTTNLRLTFTAPSGGAVLARMRGVIHGSTQGTGSQCLFGVLDGATIRGRLRTIAVFGDGGGSVLATTQIVNSSSAIVTSLTPSSSYTWDAALAVQAVAASGNLSWGGPDNTTQDDAYGGFSYDIWDAAGILPSILSTGQVI